MAEQGTHKPLVGRSNRPVAITETVDLLPGGTAMFLQASRIITPVTWLAAPDWLTIPEAAWLSGHDEDTIERLVWEGDVDTRREGDGWLIDKWSLHDFQEALALVLHWAD